MRITFYTILLSLIATPAFGQFDQTRPSGQFTLSPVPSYYQQSASDRIGPTVAMQSQGVQDPEEVIDSAEDEVEATPESASLAALEDLEKDLDERLAELEERWEAVDEKEAKAKKDAKKKPTFKLGGRIHLDHWNFNQDDPGIGFFENSDPTSARFGNDPSDRFAFRRIRMEFSGDMPMNMLWRMQMEFATPNEPAMRDVYFGWKNLPGNQTLLIGNQKRPIGLDHLNSSRFNLFLERPMVVEAFNEDARRLGVAMYGTTIDESINWRYGIYNLENIQAPGQYRGDSLQLGGYARIAGTPWYDETSGGRGYLHLGLSGSVARPDGDRFASDRNSNEARFRTRSEARSDSRWLDTGRIAGADWFEQTGIESILNIGSLQITGEYLGTFVQRDNVTGGGLPDVNFHGGYVYFNWFVTGEHQPIDRATGTLSRIKPHENFFLIDRARGGTGGGMGAIAFAYRLSFLDLSDGDITGGQSWMHTLGTNWYWTPYARVQMNLSYGEIESRGPIGGFSDGNFWVAGTRFAVDF